MPAPLAITTLILSESFLAGILVYLFCLWSGRVLKRRFDAPLGVFYQLFSVMAAVQVPTVVFKLEYPGDREVMAAFWMLASLFLIGLQRRFFWERYLMEKRGYPVPRLLPQMTEVLLLLLAVVIVAQVVYDVTIPGLVAGSGILAAIIGFAMQDLLSNLIAGFTIQFGRPFRLGDWLLVDGMHLEVTEINWRSTRLRNNDDACVDVPNTHIIKQSVINYNYPTRVHALRFSIGVDYSVPPNEAKDALLAATRTGMRVLADPPPQIFLHEFGDSSITYEIRFWLNDHRYFNDMMDSIRTNIWYEFQRRHLRIPFPMRVVELHRARATGQASARSQQMREAARPLLQRIELFRTLDDDSRETLLDGAKFLFFGRGEHIIEQGAAGDSMFVIIQGAAEVLIRHPGETQPRTVATLHEGDCFGEMSLLTGEPRSATVIVRSDCDVMEIRKRVMGEILHESPETLETLSRLLAQRRIVNEGLRSSASEPSAALARKETEYRVNFADKLRKFFSL